MQSLIVYCLQIRQPIENSSNINKLTEGGPATVSEAWALKGQLSQLLKHTSSARVTQYLPQAPKFLVTPAPASQGGGPHVWHSRQSNTERPAPRYFR